MEDIHRQTAAAAFGKRPEEVTKTERKAAKIITFGILFGQGIPAIAAEIGATEEEAQGFQDKFFSQMTGVASWIPIQKQSAQQRGYVEAPHGRRRRFWSYYLPDKYLGKRRWALRNERQAVNSPIQGIASDAAMIGGAYHLFEFIEKHQLDWKIQNLVHDSCILQVPKDEIAFAIQSMEPIFVERAMQYMQDLGVKFNLPLGIDVEGGDINWGSLIKWKGTETHALELESRVQAIWADR
jgi:DNA polymerase-1